MSLLKKYAIKICDPAMIFCISVLILLATLYLAVENFKEVNRAANELILELEQSK